MPNFKELDFKVGPSLFDKNHLFSIMIQNVFSQGLKPPIFLIEGGNVLTNKKGTNLETQLFEVKHMSRSNFFYLGLPHSVPKPAFSNMCGLLFTKDDFPFGFVESSTGLDPLRPHL